MPNFIRMDPPRHTAQRRTVAPIVAPSNLANMEGLIRQRTVGVLDGLPRNETFDWVERVSIELTTMMLATLFDFPWADRRKLTRWSDVAIANVDSPDAVVHSEDERFAELTKMGEHCRSCGTSARDAPPDFDLISMLAHGEATRNHAAARIHRQACASDRGRQRHHAQFDDRRADGADRESRAVRTGARPTAS